MTEWPLDQFRYHQGRFYLQTALPGGGPHVQLFEMVRLVDRDQVPDAAAFVELVEAGDGGKSDRPGQTWAQRAVSAEMENATQRVRIEELERAVQSAQRSRSSEIAAARRNLESEREENGRILAGLFELSNVLGKVYGRDASQDILDDREERDGFRDPEPGVATAGEIIGWAIAVLRSTHPAVAIPVPGPDDRAAAMQTFRDEIGAGAELEAAVLAALVEVAERHRDSDGRPRLSDDTPRVAQPDAGR